MPSRSFVKNRGTGANDPTYLHYFYENAESDVGLSGLHALINKSSQEIIGEHLTALSARKIDLLANNELSVDQEQAIREMIDGTFFSGMDGQTVSQYNVGANNTYYDIESAISFAQAQSALSQIQSVNDYITAFQTFLDAFFTKEGLGNVWRQYADNVIQQFAAGRSVQGEVANQIISAVLSKNSGSFFTITNPNTGESIQSFMSRLAVFIQALPYSPMYSGALGAEGSQIKQTMINKFKGWTNYLAGIAAEYAVPVTTLKANQPLFQKLRELNIAMEHAGSANVKVTFNPDERQEAILGEIDGALDRVTGVKVSKSDFNFVITTDKISATLGVNVKEAKVNQTGGPETQKVSIRLQHSSPFLTLLMREGGLSGAQMDAVIQLAGGHGDTGSLDEQWNQLVEYATYSCLLDALAGISVQEHAYFFALNGQLYTMSDILTHIQRTLNSGTAVSLVQTGGSTKNGLSRASYYRRNNWVAPAGPSRYAAEVQRSPKARQSILNAMYAAKISVNLDLAQYIVLTNSAL